MSPDQLPDHLATHQGKLLVVARNRYRARLRPVTISRNNEQFALMRREVVGKLIRGHTCLKRSTELIGAAWKYSLDGRTSTSYEWLSAFDGAELQEMAGEIISAIARAI